LIPLASARTSEGQALQILSAALAMVEGTACVEPAGKAEKAITAKSKALEPRAYGKAGRCERPSQGGPWHGVKTSLQEEEQEGYIRTRGKQPSEGHSQRARRNEDWARVRTTITLYKAGSRKV